MNLQTTMSKYEASSILASWLQGYGCQHDFIDDYINYAMPLLRRGLPVIRTEDGLIMLIGSASIIDMANHPHDFYFNFKLPKKSGGYRNISAPYAPLKIKQRWILDNILTKLPSSHNVTSYKKETNIINNASCHYDQKIVLCLDIKDFFPSINTSMVNAIFSGAGYNQQVSALLTKLCILDNSVPQGAPTSPAISNLVLKKEDDRIARFIYKHRIHYTRYADDMTFSGDFNPNMIIKFVEQILDENGFKLNHKKTRIMRKDNRQLVTGIIVNNHSLGASRAIRQQLRKTAYYINKFGIISHMCRQRITDLNYLAAQLGLAHYVKSVETAISHATQTSCKSDSKIDVVIDILLNAQKSLRKIKNLPTLIQEEIMQLKLFNCNS